jgi:hypothetical protein
MGLYPKPIHHFGEEAVGAAVDIVRENHFVAGLEQIHTVVGRGHAGTKGNGILCTLQCCKTGFIGATGGIVGPRIFVTLLGIAQTLLAVGGGLENGHRYGAGHGLRILSGVNG